MAKLAEGNCLDTDLSGQWEGAIETAVGAGASQDAESAPLLRYGFIIGEVGFLLAQEKLGEVVIDYATHPIPNTEPWFTGMTNMRGNLVPVFDLSMLFGFQHANDSREKRRLLVLDSGEMAAGILIEGLPLAISLERNRGEAPDMPDEYSKYIGDTYVDQGRVWMEFDITAFLEYIGPKASRMEYES